MHHIVSIAELTNTRERDDELVIDYNKYLRAFSLKWKDQFSKSFSI